MTPIFVIGCPRSGTSLLYWLLAAHPLLSYPDVGMRRMLSHRVIRGGVNLGLPVAHSRLLHRAFLPKPGELPYEETLRFLALDPYLPVEGVYFMWRQLFKHIDNPRNYGREDIRQYPEGVKAVRDLYGGMVRRSHRSRFIDKAPIYTVMLPVIKEVFPDAHVIHIIRDGRAVANSYAYGLKYGKHNWRIPRGPDADAIERAGPVEQGCRVWVDVIQEGCKGRDLFGSSYYELRYEWLVAQTRDTVFEIFDQVGLDRFGGDLYPSGMEDRNYKWQDTSVSSFGDPIWTDRSAIEPYEYGFLEIMRPLLESLEYVQPGASLTG